MKNRAWKKKAFRWMKKVMIPKMRAAFNGRIDENIYAHEFARGWSEGRH